MSWKPYSVQRPIAPALLLAAGVFAGVLVLAAQSPAELLAGFAVLLAAILWSLTDRQRRWRHLAVLSVAFIAAASVTSAMSPPPPPPPQNTQMTLLLERVSVGSRSQRAIAIDLADPACRIRLTLTDIVPRLRAGDTLGVEATPMPVKRYAGAPYTRTALMADRAERIVATVVVSPRDVAVLGHSGAFRFRCDELRSDFADAIHASGIPPDQAALLTAAILGGSELPPQMRADFRAAGLAHLLCVSGFHVAIVAALILGLLYPLRLYRRIGRPLAYGLTLALVWLYAMLTGFGPSVIRAAAMLTVLLLTRLSERQSLPLNSLCIAFCVVLLINPYDLFSAGFQLSFAAVAAIMLFADRLNPVSIVRKRARSLVGFFLVPVAATIGTLPVVLMWFHRISLAGVLTNGLVGLLFPLFMLAGLLTVLTHSPHGPFGDLCSWQYRLIDDMAAFGSDIGFSNTLAADTLSLLFLVLALCALAAVACLDGRPRLYALFAVPVFAVLAVGATRHYIPQHVLYLDSGARGCSVAYADSCGRGYHLGLGSRSAPPLVLSHFYAAHGINSDELNSEAITTDTLLHLPGLTMHYIHRSADVPAAAVDLAVVGHRFKGSLANYLIAVRPGAVCLASALAPERRADLAAECARNSIPCHDLTDKVFFKTLPPADLKINP